MKGFLNNGLWRRTAGFLLLITMILTVVACGGGSSSSFQSEDKLKVTTTIGMIADVAKEIGGSHVEVIGLMKAGVDPHLYKASQGDIKRLEQADLILYNGLHLEGKMGSILEKLGKNKMVVEVSKDLDRGLLLEGEGEEEYDPHIWFDVELWMTAAETIRDALVEADPDHAEAYRSQADQYLGQLRELHEYAKVEIASIPESGRVLITAHDAFQYFGRAYGIEVRGLQGLSTASEAGTRDVSELRDFLVDKGIKAVFVESSVPKKTIEAVISGAQQKGHTVTIGGELFSDAMGEEGTAEGTYIGMVRHNVDTIVKALK